MYINELRIDDFGCFRNARLENLAEDLVVIGGPQRAGKTTFMQALRQFPSGVGRDDGVPPATDQYRIDAEVTHEQQRYRYVLNGHARPSVSPIGDGPQVDAEDIFGPVTERQYSNLYTISLDELRRLPPGLRILKTSLASYLAARTVISPKSTHSKSHSAIRRTKSGQTRHSIKHNSRRRTPTHRKT